MTSDGKEGSTYTASEADMLRAVGGDRCCEMESMRRWDAEEDEDWEVVRWVLVLW